jgi:3-hydroxyisobutyrate dehydrogenase
VLRSSGCQLPSGILGFLQVTKMVAIKPIGFIGLGSMGEPMALNLIKSGIDLIVWNRTPHKNQLFIDAGALLAKSTQEIFNQCEIVFLMLTDGAAIDEVLDRHGSHFAQRIHHHTVVNMSTVTPDYSKSLELDILAAGGNYLEAPVSGSRKPAEAGQLVAMVAGNKKSIETIQPLLAPMCREIVICDAVPGGLLMKLAVNLYLITMVTGLSEATHFAESYGLDMEKFFAVLNAGPMASDVSRVKGAKLQKHDFSLQAGITDVLKNNKLVAEAARKANIASPLLDVCHTLFSETQELGLGDKDMIAVIRAIEQRSSRN